MVGFDNFISRTYARPGLKRIMHVLGSTHRVKCVFIVLPVVRRQLARSAVIHRLRFQTLWNATRYRPSQIRVQRLWKRHKTNITGSRFFSPNIVVAYECYKPLNACHNVLSFYHILRSQEDAVHGVGRNWEKYSSRARIVGDNTIKCASSRSDQNGKNYLYHVFLLSKWRASHAINAISDMYQFYRCNFNIIKYCLRHHLTQKSVEQINCLLRFTGWDSSFCLVIILKSNISDE